MACALSVAPVVELRAQNVVGAARPLLADSIDLRLYPANPVLGSYLSRPLPLGDPAEGSGPVGHILREMLRFHGATVQDSVVGSYWLEGGVLGGLGLGLVTAAFATGLAEYAGDGDGGSGVTLASFFGGALVGFVVGGLIGSGFKKHARTEGVELAAADALTRISASAVPPLRGAPPD